MDMSYAVMAFKTKADKRSIKNLTYQVAMITTKCVNPNIKLVDCIITFGGVRDILREVRNLDKTKTFQYLLIFSPKQVAKSKEEYEYFVDTLLDEFGVKVITYKE